MARLRNRDKDAHAAWAANMLYTSIVGPEPPNHPELQAFMKGFALKCSNGFTFLDVCQQIF